MCYYTSGNDPCKDLFLPPVRPKQALTLGAPTSVVKLLYAFEG